MYLVSGHFAINCAVFFAFFIYVFINYHYYIYIYYFEIYADTLHFDQIPDTFDVTHNYT